MNPQSSPNEIFHRLLDESSVLLATPESRGIAIPDDDLHREIIVPLLPAMLADAAIRGHWNEQHATGFIARTARHFENGEAAPRWTPGDFEIHVTASYSAGPDARALADTLLSEDSLRDMTAALMNQLLDALWPSLAPAPGAIPMEPLAAAEISASEITVPTAAEIPEPFISSEPVEIAGEIAPMTGDPEVVSEIHPTCRQPSRALVRALCRKLAASAIQRGIVASRAKHDFSAAIVTRRIYLRVPPALKKRRAQSRTACIG